MPRFQPTDLRAAERHDALRFSPLSNEPTAIKRGDRVRVEGVGTGRVVAVLNGWLYRVRYDKPDPFGKQTGDYLAHVLRRLSGA